MGCSIHVSGIIPADEKYIEMLNLLNMCKKNKIKVPDEVDKFFNYVSSPNPEGQEVRLKDVNDCCEGDVEYEGGMIIDIEAIPPNIKFIKVEMSC